jgi:hypothetical protein
MAFTTGGAVTATDCIAETDAHGPAPSGSVVVQTNVMGELLTSLFPGVYMAVATLFGLIVPLPVVDHVPGAFVVAVIGNVSLLQRFA